MAKKTSSSPRSSVKTQTFAQHATQVAQTSATWGASLQAYQTKALATHPPHHPWDLELEAIVRQQQQLRQRWFKSLDGQPVLMGQALHAPWVFSSKKEEEKWIKKWVEALEHELKHYDYYLAPHWQGHFFAQRTDYLNVLFDAFDAIDPQDPQHWFKQKTILEACVRLSAIYPSPHAHHRAGGILFAGTAWLSHGGYHQGYQPEHLQNNLAQRIHPQWLRRFDAWRQQYPNYSTYQTMVQWSESWHPQIAKLLHQRLPWALWFKHCLPDTYHSLLTPWLQNNHTPYQSLSESQKTAKPVYEHWSEHPDAQWIHQTLIHSLKEKTASQGLLETVLSWGRGEHQSRGLCKAPLDEAWFSQSFQETKTYQQLMKDLQTTVKAGSDRWPDFVHALYQQHENSDRLVKQFNVFEHLKPEDQTTCFRSLWDSFTVHGNSTLNLVNWWDNVPAAIHKGFLKASWAWNPSLTKAYLLKSLQNLPHHYSPLGPRRELTESFLKFLEQQEPGFLFRPLSSIDLSSGADVTSSKPKPSKKSDSSASSKTIFEQYSTLLSDAQRTQWQAKLLNDTFTRTHGPASRPSQPAVKKRL